MAITETDKAYVAGLFDGEGCVGYYNANPNPTDTPYCHASVVITMTDESIIRWVQQLFSVGHVSIAKKPQDRRTAYQWQISKKDQVRYILSTIRPYLKVKADQVDVLLDLFKEESHYRQRQGSVSSAIAARRLDTVYQLKTLKRTVRVEGVET